MMMTTGTETNLMTADDLMRLDSQGIHGELKRGVFCETMPSGGDHGVISSIVNALVFMFIEPSQLGWVTTEVGVFLERDPDTVLAPDVAYFSHERWPRNRSIPSYVEVVPDLAVEVKSPNDSRREIEEKARTWLDYGVRLVWTVHPETRTVDVYRDDGHVETFRIGDTLDGWEVLPGFSCAISRLFPF